MKKKRKRYQTVQPATEPAPEPEKIIPISAGRVQVGDIVKRKPITFSDHDRKDAGWMLGRVIWIHPLGRFHVVEFGEGAAGRPREFYGGEKMKRDTYYLGVPGVKYGIWNTVRKCWQFGICEDTPMLAEARLFQKIGDDARKWRFEPRPLPKAGAGR